MLTHFDAAAARVAAGADHHAEAAMLVASMTLAERLGCLDGDTPFWPGLFDMTSGGYYTHTWPAAQVERLGIPGIEFADGPRGCVVGDATAFPVSMARGASFDPGLEERIGEAIGRELRASGATFTGAVCMNLLRHPAWGRAQETYGEDPHHVGVMAQNLTRGLQRHVIACMKHFAVNSMENARFSVDVQVGERALHEVYLPHFERIAGEGVGSVMSSYNSMNGEWCGENETLLTTILREEWGWDGFVVSDFIFGLRDAAKSVRAGLDIEMPFQQQRALALVDALESGELTESHVDTAVTRIVATLLRFNDVLTAQPSIDVVGCDEHRRLARTAAAASTVMLRNEGALLPLDPSAVGKIAVLGRLAAVKNLGDGGSSDVKATNVVTPLAGLRARFGADRVVHSDTDTSVTKGADVVIVVVGYTKADEGEYIDDNGTALLIGELFPPMDHPTLGVLQAAAPAPAPAPAVAPAPESPGCQNPTEDAVATPAAEAEGQGGMSPGGDRTSLRLSDADEALIAAAVVAHPNVVVSVQCGSAVVMPWAESVSVVLVSWYGGVEGGSALADVLVGDAEPGGRLPFAIPTDPNHLVDFDKDATHANYDLLHGQWKLDRDGNTAHFPFGAGNGYSTFSIDAAHGTDAGAGVEFLMTNTGDRAGSTVVFVDAGLPVSAHLRPAHRLIGFARVDALAGETTTATIDLDWSMTDLRIDGDWLTEPGEYVVTVGQFAGDPAAISFLIPRGESTG